MGLSRLLVVDLQHRVRDAILIFAVRRVAVHFDDFAVDVGRDHDLVLRHELVFVDGTEDVPARHEGTFGDGSVRRELPFSMLVERGHVHTPRNEDVARLLPDRLERSLDPVEDLAHDARA